MALRTIVVFLVATAIGSTMPEVGDVLAIHLKIEPHYFNSMFLVLGFIGCCVALYLGHKGSRNLP